MRSRIIARVFLTLAFASSFLSGYAIAANAGAYNGTMYGRTTWVGYFTGTSDQFGSNVFPKVYQGNSEAFPSYINSAAPFIDFIVNQQYYGNYGGTTPQRQRGAAFIINTMLGYNAPGHYWLTNDNDPLTNDDITSWTNLIYSMQSKGHIVWRTNFKHNINSYWQGTGSGSGTIDDAFFGDAGDMPSMVFRNDYNQIAYVIKWECANPVSLDTMPPLSQPWQTTGKTKVTDNVADPGDTDTSITTRPGDTAHFVHTVKNNGPGGTAPTPIFAITQQTSPTLVPLSGGNFGTFNANEEKTVSVHDIPIPLNAAPGTQYCEQVGWDPQTSWGVRDGRGAPACATVVNSYNLTPSASPSVPYAQAGDTVQFSYVITNAGSASPPATCTVRDGGGVVVVVPGLTCASGQVFPDSSTPVPVGTENFTIPTSAAVGSSVCRTLTIAPAGGSTPSRTSPQACVIIAKTPYVHFMGGDVWSGGGFTQADGTCITNTNAKITTSSNSSVGAGSVVEYAAFALSSINKFGSGNKPLFDSANFSDLGRFMTFANNTTTLGNFGAPQHCINDYAAGYATSPAPAGAVITLPAGSGSWHAAGNLTINASTLAAGAQQAYLVDGNVTITGNINYVNAGAPSYTGAAQIPSLLIISKGDIYIDPAVQRLDGMYIARGVFYTCYPKPSPPSTSTCNNPLTVNGTVAARSIDLYRTRGADGNTVAQRQVPAEVFNLSPEVYLHNILNNTALPAITTSDSRELPPRF